MKKLILIALFFPMYSQADGYISVDTNFREEGFTFAAGWLPFKLDNGSIGGEIAFTSCGKQPEGFNNINKMLQANLVGRVYFSPSIIGFGKVGIHTTEYSENGTNDYDRKGDSLIGYNATAGIETPITENIMLYGSVTVFEYRQVNNKNMGGYTYPSIGFKYVF